MNILDLLENSESILGLTGTTKAPSDNHKFAVPRGTLVFLQLAYTEAFRLILQALVNDNNSGNIYLLYGCVAESVSTVGTSTTYIFNSGAIFYKGEIFLYDGGQVTVPNGTLPNINIVTTYYTGDGQDADPVTYTDGSTHYIHNIRKINISASSGANTIGAYNLNGGTPGVIPFAFNIPPQVNITGSGAVTITGNYPNITVNTPPLLNRVLTAGSLPIGGHGDIAYGAGNPLYLDFRTPISMPGGTPPAPLYYVMGTLRSYGIAYNDASVTWNVMEGSQTAAGCYILFNEITGIVQDLYFDYIVFAYS